MKTKNDDITAWQKQLAFHSNIMTGRKISVEGCEIVIFERFKYLGNTVTDDVDS